MKAFRVPPLEVVGPDGRWLAIRLGSPADTIGDLARLVGLGSLAIDGRAVAADTRLADAGLRRGVRLTATATRRPAPGGEWLVDPLTGPAVSRPVGLPCGRGVLGRSAAADVRLPDGDLEPHVGLLDVRPDGVRFTQLTGRLPVRSAGIPIAGTRQLADGDELEVGAHRLRISRPAAADPAPAAVRRQIPGDPWRVVLDRQPRELPAPFDEVLVPPEDPGPRLGGGGVTGIVTALVGAAGGGIVALVMHQVMFLLFSVIGLAVAIGTWVSGRISRRRAGTKGRRQHEADRVEFLARLDEVTDRLRQRHRALTPMPSAVLDWIATDSARIWARRPDHPDARQATIGRGAVTWPPPVAEAPVSLAGEITRRLESTDEPIGVTFDAGTVTAVAGLAGVTVVRSILVQLAALEGPADWRLAIVTDQPGRWGWARPLPHLLSPTDVACVAPADDRDALTAMLGSLDDRHTVVVTDRPDVLTARTGPVRRFLAEHPSAAAIVVLDDADAAVPAVCGRVLRVGVLGRATWAADVAVAGHPLPVAVAGMSAGTALEACSALAHLVDAEDAGRVAASTPTRVAVSTLAEEHGSGAIDDAIAVAARWRCGGRDVAPAAPIGLTGDGVVEIDLVQDGPHALIAGTTGSGKSELLRTLVVSLAAAASPEQVTFVLVDYKGGSTFDACVDLPHTLAVVTDLDAELAERAMISLEAELRRREHLLRSVGAADLTDYRARPDTEALPRLVVVIDELAALVTEVPAFVPALISVAQRGRSLGVHLILATQRPHGVISDDIRANTNLRIALRLPDAADARDVVGVDDPAGLPRSVPGRAVLRMGPGELVTFQAASCTMASAPSQDPVLGFVDDERSPGSGTRRELEVLVQSICQAASLLDVPAPHRVWAPPLPAELRRAEIAERLGEAAAGALGLVDEPGRQAQSALEWTGRRGNLAVLGAMGAGVTSTIRAVVAAALRRGGSVAEVYVLDALGDPGYDELARRAAEASVVRMHELERLHRTIRTLDGIVQRRRADERADGHEAILLAIDGWSGITAALDGPHDHVLVEALRAVLTDGPSVGVHAVVGATRPAALPGSVLAACAERWVLHLTDASDAPMVGVAASAVPAAVPGRLVVASSGAVAQVAIDGPDLGGVGAPPSSRSPRRIEVLPSIVGVDELPPPKWSVDGLELPVGIDDESLDTAWLLVPDGEHLVVIGPSRSGRSGVVASLRHVWGAAAPGGRVAVVCGSRRSPFAELAVPVDRAVEVVGAAGGPALLLVDDAELVDDPAGRLAGLAADAPPGCLIVAAARADALRTSYGHWTGAIRRRRRGVLMAGCDLTDGDLLGTSLPRQRSVALRPGLGYVVADGDRRLVQLATAATW